MICDRDRPEGDCLHIAAAATTVTICKVSPYIHCPIIPSWEEAGIAPRRPVSRLADRLYDRRSAPRSSRKSSPQHARPIDQAISAQSSSCSQQDRTTHRLVKHVRQEWYNSNAHRRRSPPPHSGVGALGELPARILDSRMDSERGQGHTGHALEYGSLYGNQS